MADLFEVSKRVFPVRCAALSSADAGAGLTFRFGFHPSPFGEAIAVETAAGLAGLGWVDAKDRAGTAATTGKAAGGRDGALADMTRRWPRGLFVEDVARTARLVARAFDPGTWHAGPPLPVTLIGTPFEIEVWQALTLIPPGETTTYGVLAQRLGRPGGARAVGAAVGRNPVSFVVPCHRVVGASGALTGYHWGIGRKSAILAWEAQQTS